MVRDKIEVKVYSFIDGDGNTVYDFESMAEEFEDRLSELDKNLLVMCSIDEIGPADRNNELSRLEMEDLKVKQNISNEIESGTIALA